jgi:hypothetical protein
MYLYLSQACLMEGRSFPPTPGCVVLGVSFKQQSSPNFFLSEDKRNLLYFSKQQYVHVDFLIV